MYLGAPHISFHLFNEFFLISLPSVFFAFPTSFCVWMCLFVCFCSSLFCFFVCFFVFLFLFFCLVYCLFFVFLGFFCFFWFFVLSFFHKKLFQIMFHFKAIPPKLNQVHRNIITTLMVKNILNYKKIFNLLKLVINYHINPLVVFF